MATQTIEFRAAAGLTLAAELFAIGSDTIVATASATEQTNRNGTYRVAYTSIAAGEYQLVAFSGAVPVASWLVTLTLDTATFQVFERSTAVNMRGTDSAATAANLAAAKTVIDAILVDTDATIPATLTEIKGATFIEATDALDAVRAAVDARSVVNVLPAVGIVADRSPGATISPVVGETISQSITLYQTDGTTPVDLSGKTLAIVFETMAGVDVAVVASGNIAISGDDDNTVTFAYPSAVTASERTLRFAIKDAAAPLTEYLKGLCNVTSGPRVDA